MSSLEQSGNRIPDAWPVIFTFSLLVTYGTKTEKRTKKSATQLYNIALRKGTIFVKKNADFLQKNMLTSAKLKGPWY